MIVPHNRFGHMYISLELNWVNYHVVPLQVVINEVWPL